SSSSVPSSTLSNLLAITAPASASFMCSTLAMTMPSLLREMAVRQQKTDEPLMIPMDANLMQALAATPRTNLTFLVTERGAPFTSAGFGNWFRDRCNEAGLAQCSAHGLRKAAATRLANAGCSTDQIKAITGHRSLSEVARYTKAAD